MTVCMSSGSSAPQKQPDPAPAPVQLPAAQQRMAPSAQQNLAPNPSKAPNRRGGRGRGQGWNDDNPVTRRKDGPPNSM